MSTSHADTAQKQALKTGTVYLLAALLCALFGAVYEQFSHGVYSYFMIYAFLIPLTAGAFPFCLAALCASPVMPGRLALNCYHSGIAAWTVGCIFQGALEIYGTSNRGVSVYWCAGTIFTVLGLIFFLVRLIKPKNKTDK